MSRKVCERHDALVIHAGSECPLCTANTTIRQLLRFAETRGALPRLPTHHDWVVRSGQIHVLGPDWGYCVKTAEWAGATGHDICCHGPLPGPFLLEEPKT